jgi:hypothetical protein
MLTVMKISFTWKSYVLSILFGLILTFALSGVVSSVFFDGNLDFSVVKSLPLLILLIPVHELIHYVLFPDLKNAKIGFSLKRVSFFAYTSTAMSRSRFILVASGPVLILTFLPLVCLFVDPQPFFARVALINLLGSGMDLLILARILFLPGISRIIMEDSAVVVSLDSKLPAH